MWRARGFRIFADGTDISLLQRVLRYGLSGLRAGGAFDRTPRRLPLLQSRGVAAPVATTRAYPFAGLQLLVLPRPQHAHDQRSGWVGRDLGQGLVARPI